MAPTIISSKLTLKSPLFCAGFFEPPTDSDEPVTVVVAGGGGEGRNGVGNRITIIDVSNPSEARAITEADLSKEEDSPMSLCTLPGGGIVAGINSGEKVIQESRGSANLHFRVFKQDQYGAGGDDEKQAIKEVSKKAIFSSAVLREGDMYQRLCRGKGNVVVIGSGGGKKAENELVVLRRVGNNEWNVSGRIRPEEGKEAADVDVDLDADGEEWTVVWGLPQGVYISSSADDGTSTSTAAASPKPIYTLTPNSGVFRSLRIISHNSLSTPANLGTNRIIATIVNLPTRSGAHLLLLSSPSDSNSASTLLSRRPLHRNIRAATSMDLISLPPTTNSRGQPQGQTILAVSGADQSVEILVLDYPLNNNEDYTPGSIRIRTLKTFNNVHPFQITKVAFSQPVKNPQGGYELKLATVSMGQTVVTYTIPLITVSRNTGSEGAAGSSTAALFNPSSPPTPSLEKTKRRGKSNKGILETPVPFTTLSSSDSSSKIKQQPLPGMYVLAPPGTRRATIYSVTVSLGLVVILAILLQLVFVYRGGLLVGPMGVDALSQMEYPVSGVEMDEDRINEEKIVEAVREAAEVAGEWMVEEGRKVAGGVVKGMVRGAVEQGVRGVLGG